MKGINHNRINGKNVLKKRRGAAEVISSLLLVAITVVGAVILTSFLDETFVAGTMSTSTSESSLKSIKLIGFDARDGDNLLKIQKLDNGNSTDQILCRNSCVLNTNKSPSNNGTEFLVIQVENKGANSVFLHNVYLDGVNHEWDSSTSGTELDSEGSFAAGNFPEDGAFSILALSGRCFDVQCSDNQILDGERVNLVIKLDHDNDDIPLSKTIQAQFNIGDNTLSSFLIESGGAR